MNTLLYFLFGMLIYMHIETRFLFINKIDITESNKGNTKFKVAHLSDIHIGKMFVPKWIIKRAIKNNNPDCIVLTGDYVEKTEHIEKLIKFLKYINPNQVPILAVWGNHDHKLFNINNNSYKELKNLLKENGITVLENQNISFEKHSLKYCFVGINDFFHGSPDINKAFKDISEEKRVIAISHNPDIIFNLQNRRFNLLLCGHFHGGQIYLPFSFENKILRNEKLAKMGIVKGLNEVAGHRIYINRGIGNVLLPFRFLSPPEIAFIEL